MRQNCVLVIIIDLGTPQMYVGYPESKFQWATEKTITYFETISIAIVCTYCTLLFNIVSTIVEALVIAGHQFLYPCIPE
jgi:hypothetical protein